MKIGILVCGHLDESLSKKHGTLDTMFETLLDGYGLDFESFAVVDDVFPASITQCDGWLVSGSIHGVYESHAWIPKLEDFIRNSYANDIPIAGICFGHQIMAQALGGKVVKYSEGWGLGHSNYGEIEGADASTSSDQNKKREVNLLACHQDQVVEIPHDAKVILQSSFCENAGLAYRGSAISFQPHPEFAPQFMRDLVEFKMSRGFPAEEGRAAIAAIGNNYDAARIAGQLANFFLSAGVTKSQYEAAE